MEGIKIGVVGDYNPAFRPHPATNEAVEHAASSLSIKADVEWLPTEAITEASLEDTVRRFDALWVAPGSPYKNMDGALRVIKFARENLRPMIGTCGGLQHIVIEYARNVLNFKDAEHAEYNPYGSNLFIIELTCSLAGQKLSIRVRPASRAFEIYQKDVVEEEYYCNFGINPYYQDLIDKSGLRVSGVEENGEARILELPDHPFFLATLFVPQLRSSADEPHPLVVAFLNAAKEFKSPHLRHAQNGFLK